VANSILPKYSKLIYRLSSESRYFIQSEIDRQETPINRLPKELRLAPTGAAQIKTNATQMLLDRPLKGKHSFRTGIQETFFTDWYLGNDFERAGSGKKISVILFHFIKAGAAIEVYYFYHYDKPNTFHRLQFANSIIPYLTTPGPA
jgi:hypothetical protein